jgi:hypothetical protein
MPWVATGAPSSGYAASNSKVRKEIVRILGSLSSCDDVKRTGDDLFKTDCEATHFDAKQVNRGSVVWYKLDVQLKAGFKNKTTVATVFVHTAAATLADLNAAVLHCYDNVQVADVT